MKVEILLFNKKRNWTTWFQTPVNVSVGWYLCLNGYFFDNYEEPAGRQGVFLWRQTSWSGSCSPSVPLSVHGVGVSVLPDQWRRHVRDILRAAGEQHTGVAVQSSVPVHLYLPLHLHGAVTLHRPDHGRLRDHQGRKGLLAQTWLFFRVFDHKSLLSPHHSTKHKSPSTSQICTPL